MKKFTTNIYEMTHLNKEELAIIIHNEKIKNYIYYSDLFYWDISWSQINTELNFCNKCNSLFSNLFFYIIFSEEIQKTTNFAIETKDLEKNISQQKSFKFLEKYCKNNIPTLQEKCYLFGNSLNICNGCKNYILNEISCKYILDYEDVNTLNIWKEINNFNKFKKRIIYERVFDSEEEWKLFLFILSSIQIAIKSEFGLPFKKLIQNNKRCSQCNKLFESFLITKNGQSIESINEVAWVNNFYYFREIKLLFGAKNV